MKRTWILIGTTLALVVAATVVVLTVSRRSPWTTRSPQALAAFEAGLEARMRYYNNDAQRDFERALELDPDFAAARVLLLSSTYGKEERQKLIDKLEKTDLEPLSARERFLVTYALAQLHNDPDRASQLLDTFLARHPRDPWGLSIASGRAWDREDFDEASRLYQRLLDVDPNWLQAKNHLGYLDMARGKFAAAEEAFRSYAYAAPDQANPHDSLGELLTLIGRYPEAKAELEKALAVRPDFCASYGHLIRLALAEAQPEAFGPILDRAAKNCAEMDMAAIRCQALWFGAFLRSDFDAPWRDGFAEKCDATAGGEKEMMREPNVLEQRLALLTGRDAVARAQEAIPEQILSSSRKLGRTFKRLLEADQLHMKGVRDLAEGRPADAVASLREADQRMTYWGVDQGQFKLFNLLTLARAERRAGDAAGADATVAQVAAVNRPFAEQWSQFQGLTPEPPSGH
jgi:tetratricopeptide (TPR) repeat protein